MRPGAVGTVSGLCGTPRTRHDLAPPDAGSQGCDHGVGPVSQIVAAPRRDFVSVRPRTWLMRWRAGRRFFSVGIPRTTVNMQLAAARRFLKERLLKSGLRRLTGATL